MAVDSSAQRIAEEPPAFHISSIQFHSISLSLLELVLLSSFDHFKMSGCGSSACSCGAACNCSTGNSCCPKRSVDSFESSEMRGFEGANEGCKCGDNCSCNPCNCK